jgi:flagellar FliJ protein
MARSFPLAGLLRLRQVQQDQAAIDLAAANARVAEGTARQRRARSSLGATSSEAASTSVLYAVAASRAASRGMLAELQALECDHLAALDTANTAFTSARSRSIGLEKLEVRFDDAVASGALRAEQAVLDEIASTGWHRTREVDAG